MLELDPDRRAVVLEAAGRRVLVDAAERLRIDAEVGVVDDGERAEHRPALAELVGLVVAGAPRDAGRIGSQAPPRRRSGGYGGHTVASEATTDDREAMSRSRIQSQDEQVPRPLVVVGEVSHQVEQLAERVDVGLQQDG